MSPAMMFTQMSYTLAGKKEKELPLWMFCETIKVFL